MKEGNSRIRQVIDGLTATLRSQGLSPSEATPSLWPRRRAAPATSRHARILGRGVGAGGDCGLSGTAVLHHEAAAETFRSAADALASGRRALSRLCLDSPVARRVGTISISKSARFHTSAAGWALRHFGKSAGNRNSGRAQPHISAGERLRCLDRIRFPACVSACPAVQVRWPPCTKTTCHCVPLTA